MSGSSPLDLRDILWKVRHLVWIGLLPIVTAACAGVLYLVITRQYEATATVSAGEHTKVSSALEPLVGDQPGIADTQTPTVLQVDNHVHSRPFLTSVVNQLGLARSKGLLLRATEDARRLEGVTPEDLALRRAVGSVSKRIHVYPVGAPGKSPVTLVRLGALGSTPLQAQKLATTVVNTLVQENAISASEAARTRGEFSSEQIRVYEDKVRRSENALRSYEESMIGGQLSDVPVDATNIGPAREVVRTTDEELAQIRERLRVEQIQWRGQAGVDATPPDLSNANTTALEARLKDQEVNLGISSLRGVTGATETSALKLKIGDTRQSLFSAYKDAARDQKSLSDEASDLAAGIALDRSELRSLREKKDRMTNYIARYSRGVQRSPRDQMELQRLRDEVERNRALLSTLQKEAASSQLSEAIQESRLGFQIELIEAPLLPLTPYPTPRLMKIMSAAVLAGVFLSVIVIIGMIRFRESLCSLETAEEALQIKALGTIPRIEAWAPPGTFLGRNWALVSLAVVILTTAALCVVHGSDHRAQGTPRQDAPTLKQ